MQSRQQVNFDGTSARMESCLLQLRVGLALVVVVLDTTVGNSSCCRPVCLVVVLSCLLLLHLSCSVPASRCDVWDGKVPGSRRCRSKKQ